jgi:hypothetical protein
MEVARHAKVIKNIAEDLSPEEIYQARLIVARQKFWTPDVEKLLRTWRRQICILQRQHKLEEVKYNVRYYLVGVPASILSTIVASGVLTTFRNCNECLTGCIPDQSGCENDEWIRLAMGIIGIFAIVFTCLSVFLNYGQASRDSKSSAEDFGSLTRNIDLILETPVSTRGDPITVLNGIRAEYDDISKNSPISSFQTLEYRTIEREKITPPRSDQINLKRTKIPDASSLAKILIDNLEAEEKERINVQKRVKEENDHDTDEEKEVVISFDFEGLKSEDLLENERRNVAQKSLERALQFELSRMYSDSKDQEKEVLPTSPTISPTAPRRKKKKPPKEKEELQTSPKAESL